MALRARVTLAGDVHGIHARPSAEIAMAVAGLNATVRLSRGGQGVQIDVGSVLAWLMAAGDLNLSHGTTFDLACEGPDAEAAFEGLKSALTQGSFAGSRFDVVPESEPAADDEPPPLPLNPDEPPAHRLEELVPETEAPRSTAAEGGAEPKWMGTVLFVEDEMALLDEFPRVLRRKGYRVLCASRPDDALRIIRETDHFDVAVSDLKLPMEGCEEIGLDEALGGRRAGLVIAKAFRDKFKRAPIIFWSSVYDRELRAEVIELGNSRLVSKSAGPKPVMDMIDDCLDGFDRGKRPMTFVVHGHDSETMNELKSFLQGDLGFPEPVVLREQPWLGRTIIEKLESYTYCVDLVFCLLTPDDKVIASGSAEEMFRSRQNVIFEMGYFLGVLGRSTGRVILLYKRPIELPSDISGMVSIDISGGVRSAANEIRQELREWL
jgi:phosphotransferase system HPr (HPr) family protein